MTSCIIGLGSNIYIMFWDWHWAMVTRLMEMT